MGNRGSSGGWAVVTVLLVAACGESSSGSPAATTDAATGSGGALGAGGSAGAPGGSGNATSTGGGPASCTAKLLTADPGCPTDDADYANSPSSPPCPKEGLVCKFQETTGATCAPAGQSAYACCAGRWMGADVCPKPVPGQNAACPADLPNIDDPFNPPACPTKGLLCGYYPVGIQDDQQQDIACCDLSASLGLTGLHWRSCLPNLVGSAPAAPSCGCP